MLIIETGQIVDGANSYVDVAYADEYEALVVNTTWAGLDDDAKERALKQSTRALHQRYGEKFCSALMTDDQPLLFPRIAFVDRTGRMHDNNTIPQCLKEAQVELAFLFASQEEVFLEDQTNQIKSTQVVLGPLSTTTTYSTALVSKEETFTKAELLLKPILKGPISSWRLRT
ncbi:DnaT-like ssDNA-binding protein [Aquabacterium sp.]|uniref:DnaT-like ssDNA-binding protein n=1 Tax=Aquabacterium sp. TaxID=1872578 RepID=UPI003D6D4485